MDVLLSNLRHAVRSLGKRPGFALVAVATLGLGIGATTAMFTVVNGVLLRPLAYEEPERLLHIWTHFRGDTHNSNSGANFHDYQARIEGLASVGAFGFHRCHFGDGGETRRILLSRFTSEVIPTLGISPLLGRSFDENDDELGAGPIAVISHGLWQRSFGGVNDVVGKTIVLHDRPTTIVGVMPAAFTFPSPDVEAWIPLQLDPSRPQHRTNHNYGVIARLRGDVSFDQVQAELAGYSRQIVEEYPQNYATFEFGASAVGLYDETVGDTRTPLLVLSGAVAFVLLIACANVANLLLVRAESRNHELALRRALGASSGRVAGYVVSEGLVLATAGGVLGVAIAYWGNRFLVAIASDTLPRLEGVSLDGPVLAFTALVSVLTGLLAGSLPALRTSRGNLHGLIQTAGRSQSPSAGARTRSVLVGAEVALAVMLLVGAGVLIRSFAELRRADVGFRTDRVLTMWVSLPETETEPGPTVNFFETLLARAEALPAVSSVGVARRLPLASGFGRWSFQLEDNIVENIGEAPTTNFQTVSPGYFDALGMRLNTGRWFTGIEPARGPMIGIVNETFVSRFYPGESALGKRVRVWNPERPWIEIVGVVADIRAVGIAREAEPTLYVPLEQMNQAAGAVPNSMALVMHSDGDAADLAGPIRSLIGELRSDIVIADVRTFSQIKMDVTADRQFPTVLLGVFGGVALFLAAIGVYGMVSYSAAQRQHEIAVRVALGADTKNVLNLVMSRGLTPVLAGLGAGLLGAWMIAGVLTSLLYNVSPTDPLTFTAALALIGAVAFIANFLPAHRAAKLDPMPVLRDE